MGYGPPRFSQTSSPSIVAYLTDIGILTFHLIKTVQPSEASIPRSCFVSVSVSDLTEHGYIYCITQFCCEATKLIRCCSAPINSATDYKLPLDSQHKYLQQARNQARPRQKTNPQLKRGFPIYFTIY